jgi:hypothetical protein
METITIELTNPKALNLLVELAELHLIRFIKQEPVVKPKLSSLLRGSISTQAADEFNESTQKSRNEWERNI